MAPQAARPSFLARYVFSTHHKTIGLQYLWLALASVLVGVVLSTLLRMHSPWPNTAIPFLNGFENTPEGYAAVRFRKLSVAAADWGFGDGVPAAKHAGLLVDRGFACGHDCFFFLRAGNW